MFQKLVILMVLLVSLFAKPAIAGVWDQETYPLAETPNITVYRSPACNCCHHWIEHLEHHGFQVEDVETDAIDAIKQQHHVTADLESCHTAIANGYVFEGHVPADDIKRFLHDHPSAVGLTVPHMPTGSPGMEDGDRKDPFSVLTFDASGETSVFHDYPSY